VFLGVAGCKESRVMEQKISLKFVPLARRQGICCCLRACGCSPTD
jgi:hypothetical protein